MVDSLPDWAPENVDPSTPSAARMYDYFLGGEHNFEADRAVARQILTIAPEIEQIVRANRAFLHRAVRYLAGQGVRQFIDLGSGIPSVGNVHDTAQELAPDSRVLYVDHDPVAVAHSAEILRDNPNAQVVEADLLSPETILAAADLIDLDRPVGVLMVSVLHFIADDGPIQAAIHELRDRVAPGSYLVITHVTDEAELPHEKEITDLYAASSNPVTLRSRARILAFFEGWDLVEPGAVWVPEWHPDQPVEEQLDPSSTGLIVAVGRRAGS